MLSINRVMTQQLSPTHPETLPPSHPEGLCLSLSTLTMQSGLHIHPQGAVWAGPHTTAPLPALCVVVLLATVIF